ncbi:MAG: site-2 protease family protein [Firmicutes bacterium]|nr:site-2 protease family protein [Bacillota bacterium]
MALEGPASEPHAGPPQGGLGVAPAVGAVLEAFPDAVPLEGTPPAFLLSNTAGARDRFLALQRRLAAMGFLPLLRMHEGRPVLRLVPKPPPGRWARHTNLLLLLATVVTTYISGYYQALGLAELGFLDDAVASGMLYSASLLLILGAHEMGHKIVATRRGIDASLPYFLPMVPLPPLPGTLGAVIVTRTPAPNRDSLMDLGASGPIAGFLAAIPVLAYGVTQSFVVRPADVTGAIAYPDPLLIQWMIRLLLHPDPGMVVLGHPVLYAGWIGLIVTSINLLPAGMLDGGHVVRAALGSRAHAVLSYAGLALAVVMGYYPMAIIIALLIRRGHVGPLDDLSPLSPSRRVLAAVLVAIFVLSAVFLHPFGGL